jgi:copper(I)-binding protein
VPFALLIGALAIPAVTGCEAGLNAPTLAFHPAAAGNGATSSNGNVVISNAFILGPALGQQLQAGSDAGLFVSISSASGDQLTGVSAQGAASVKIDGGSVNVPANGAANLTGPAPHLVLTDLSAPLSGGQTINVTFTFAGAGPVTLAVPVQPHAYDYTTYQPPVAAPSPSPSSTASLASKTHKKKKKAAATATATASATASPTPTP